MKAYLIEYNEDQNIWVLFICDISDNDEITNKKKTPLRHRNFEELKNELFKHNTFNSEYLRIW